MIYTGKKVYDPLTDTYSTGYWVKDSQGNWYPVWRGESEIKNGKVYNGKRGAIEILTNIKTRETKGE